MLCFIAVLGLVLAFYYAFRGDILTGICVAVITAGLLVITNDVFRTSEKFEMQSESLTGMFCTSCGAAVKETDQFCSSCGQKIKSE